MFHFAFPVINLNDTTDFYVNTLGTKIGRLSSGWKDFNLRWKQITVCEDSIFNELNNKKMKRKLHSTHIRFILTFGILIIFLVTIFHFIK